MHGYMSFEFLCTSLYHSYHVSFRIQVLLCNPNFLLVISTTCRTVTHTRSQSKFTIEISNWSGLMVRYPIWEEQPKRQDKEFVLSGGNLIVVNHSGHDHLFQCYRPAAVISSVAARSHSNDFFFKIFLLCPRAMVLEHWCPFRLGTRARYCFILRAKLGT